jgi:hypothetical protein
VPFGLAGEFRLEVDFADKTRTYLDLWELEIGRLMRRLCGPGMVCFDIGRYYGWHALPFAKLGANVVTFEPDAEVLQRIRRNLELNPELKVDVADACWERVLYDSTSWGPPISSSGRGP